MVEIEKKGRIKNKKERFLQKKKWLCSCDNSYLIKNIIDIIGIVSGVSNFLLLRHRFRFSIDLILVRELTLYTLSRSTPYIVIPVFGLTCWKFTKDEAREKRKPESGLF